MSAPAFAPERDEIWYSDGFSGFYAVKVTNDAWPSADEPAPEPRPRPRRRTGATGASGVAAGDRVAPCLPCSS